MNELEHEAGENTLDFSFNKDNSGPAPAFGGSGAGTYNNDNNESGKHGNSHKLAK